MLSLFPFLTLCQVLFILSLSCLVFAALLLCISFFLQKIFIDYLLKYFFYPIFSPLSFWGINTFDYFTLSHMSHMICFSFVFHRFYYLCFSLDTFIDLSLRFMILSLVVFSLPISLSNELLILSILFYFFSFILSTLILLRGLISLLKFFIFSSIFVILSVFFYTFIKVILFFCQLITTSGSSVSYFIYYVFPPYFFL